MKNHFLVNIVTLYLEEKITYTDTLDIIIQKVYLLILIMNKMQILKQIQN